MTFDCIRHIACSLLGLCAVSTGVFASGSAIEPEVTTQLQPKQTVFARHFMAVTANPYATSAALTILKKGGSAIDAAIAAQLVLNLVEPQSSGLGGGAFLLYFNQETKKLQSFDGRETAPLAAKPERFLKPDGSPMSWHQAWGGGRSVGAPGVVALLALVHQQQGHLSWHELFLPAIELAEKGFEVSPRLASLLQQDYNPWLKQLEPSASYFYPNGQALQAGTVLKNIPLAKTLKRIATLGSQGFYQGELAENLVKTVQQSPINPGDLQLADLVGYQAKQREPLCSRYHQYQVCGMAPPSSGGLAVSQLLGLLEPYDVSGITQSQAHAAHLFTQASRLAFADRNQYVGDPDFVDVPVQALLSPAYLTLRRQLIDPKKDMGQIGAGQPSGLHRQSADSPEQANTSHISIVDGEGNALSMTTSIEMAFGSGVMVDGYLLNNQLTDFSFTPKAGGAPVANALAAGKRPRSSMAPMMILDETGQPYLILGSPGGSRIINYVAQTLIGVLDGGLTIQQAINLPKVTNRNDVTALEVGRWPESTVEQLKTLGHNVQMMDLNSGLHGIQRVKGGWVGGADQRREGVALGE